MKALILAMMLSFMTLSAALADGNTSEPDIALTALAADEITSADLYNAPTSEWADPPEATRDGQGVYNLTVAMADNIIAMNGRDHRVQLRAYNGSLVGPTIRFKAGEELKIRLRNQLPREIDRKCDEPQHSNTPACFNLTNLHTHGLHVSPKTPADDVFKVIHPPEGEFLYRYPILPLSDTREKPAKHYPGTFWYHAHRHGSTAIQLASGMAGALILEGDIDQWPGVAGTVERLFVFQQLAWDRDGEIKQFNDILPNWAGTNPSNGPPKHTTVNGRVNPVIHMDIDQVERWRWIDAGVFEMLDMVLISDTGRIVPLHQIAIDGITLKTVTRRNMVRMGPGYRTDLLVRAPSEGRYRLFKRQSPFKLGGGELDSADVDNAQVLATIVVSNDRCTDCPALLPHGAKLPFPQDMLPDITRVDNPGNPRKVTFGARRPPQQPPIFLVNGEQYKHGRIDHKVELETTEEWLLENTDPGSPGRPQAHPFHIHVNAFQMLDEKGQPAEWRDTIIVPPRPHRGLRMRTRYERFDGTFVLHCHILTHEDMGMMQAVEIVDPKAVDPKAIDPKAHSSKGEHHDH